MFLLAPFVAPAVEPVGVSRALPEPEPPPAKEAESVPFNRAFPDEGFNGSVSFGSCQLLLWRNIAARSSLTGNVQETELLLNMRSWSITPPFRRVAVPGPDAVAPVEAEALM